MTEHLKRDTTVIADERRRAERAEGALKALTYALFRSNIDWAEAARTCGDPDCKGNCNYIRMIREIVREWDGGILPPREVGEP